MNRLVTSHFIRKTVFRQPTSHLNAYTSQLLNSGRIMTQSRHITSSSSMHVYPFRSNIGRFSSHQYQPSHPANPRIVKPSGVPRRGLSSDASKPPHAPAEGSVKPTSTPPPTSSAAATAVSEGNLASTATAEVLNAGNASTTVPPQNLSELAASAANSSDKSSVPMPGFLQRRYAKFKSQSKFRKLITVLFYGFIVNRAYAFTRHFIGIPPDPSVVPTLQHLNFLPLEVVTMHDLNKLTSDFFEQSIATIQSNTHILRDASVKLIGQETEAVARIQHITNVLQQAIRIIEDQLPKTPEAAVNDPVVASKVDLVRQLQNLHTTLTNLSTVTMKAGRASREQALLSPSDRIYERADGYRGTIQMIFSELVGEKPPTIEPPDTTPTPTDQESDYFNEFVKDKEKTLQLHKQQASIGSTPHLTLFSRFLLSVVHSALRSDNNSLSTAVSTYDQIFTAFGVAYKTFDSLDDVLAQLMSIDTQVFKYEMEQLKTNPHGKKEDFEAQYHHQKAKELRQIDTELVHLVRRRFNSAFIQS